MKRMDLISKSKIPQSINHRLSSIINNKKNMKQKAGHPKFYKILKELADLHNKKNYDYAGKGNNPLGNFKRCGSMVRALLKEGGYEDLKVSLIYMSKQIDAVIDMIGNGREAQVEGITDKLNDIAVYAILSRILYEENNRKL